MTWIGYLPHDPAAVSVEAGWLGDRLAVPVEVIDLATAADALRGSAAGRGLGDTVGCVAGLRAVVAEGIQGFAAATRLRRAGFTGLVALLPYVNPLRWADVATITAYLAVADPRDRVFVGSAASAAVLAAFGVSATVAEPFGIDDELYRPRPGHHRVRRALGLGPGRILLYAGRAQPDKDLYRLLRVGLRARLLFADLQVVLASHVDDEAYLVAARAELGEGDGVAFVHPTRAQLADLYAESDVLVTASTSGYETFGRAPVEALACGTPAVAPRYAGFPEVLDQPGGRLADLSLNGTAAPHVSEEHLLRAVYDVLSSPAPPSPDLVSATARRRFGRSRTLACLDYLTGGPLPPVAHVRPAELDVPPAVERDRVASDDPDPDAADALLAVAVRRALCPRPVPGRSTATQGVGWCR